MSDAYHGFHGSAVKLRPGISFSRERAHATWRHGVPQAVLFCHIVGDYLTDAFWRPRHVQCTIPAIPVPSGIRQFCCVLFRSLCPSLSLVRSARRIYHARCRWAQTRIAQREITQKFNSTLNSLRPEMRYGCNQASIVHKWLAQQNRINQNFLSYFYGKLCEII